jgi:predicted outer membrane protein
LDANIVALLGEANKADSALGPTALPRATSASVKGFARLMRGEHHALRVMVQDLAKKQNITPQLPADDPFTTAVHDEQSALDGAARGHAFDSMYIGHEIGTHRAVLGGPEQRMARRRVTAQASHQHRRTDASEASRSRPDNPEDCRHVEAPVARVAHAHPTPALPNAADGAAARGQDTPRRQSRSISTR